MLGPRRLLRIVNPPDHFPGACTTLLAPKIGLLTHPYEPFTYMLHIVPERQEVTVKGPKRPTAMNTTPDSLAVLTREEGRNA